MKADSNKRKDLRSRPGNNIRRQKQNLKWHVIKSPWYKKKLNVSKKMHGRNVSKVRRFFYLKFDDMQLENKLHQIKLNQW